MVFRGPGVLRFIEIYQIQKACEGSDNHRLGGGLSGLSETLIGVSFEDVHEEIFDVTGFPD